MLKKVCLALGCAAVSLGAFAQDNSGVNYEKYPKVGKFEVEWQVVGAALPFGSGGEFGYDGGLQVRENLQGTPWSYGAYVGVYMPQKLVTTTSSYDGSEYKTTEYVGAVLTGVVGEYDFKRGKGLNPYINASAGFGWGGTRTLRPYLRPTVGVEIFNHMRMSVSTTLMPYDGCGFSFNISAVFGGGPK